MAGNTLEFQIDGYEILATFTEEKNTTIARHLEQVLIASYVDRPPVHQSGDILAAATKEKTNQEDADHSVL